MVILRMLLVPGFAESSGFKTLRPPSLFCFEIFVELFSRISLDKLGQVLFYRCISVLNVFFCAAVLFCVYLLVISFTEWLLQVIVNKKACVTYFYCLFCLLNWNKFMCRGLFVVNGVKVHMMNKCKTS